MVIQFDDPTHLARADRLLVDLNHDRDTYTFTVKRRLRRLRPLKFAAKRAVRRYNHA